MPLQRSQGKPRPAPCPADEVPVGVPESAGAPIARDARGRVQQGTSGARALASKGGQAAKQAREWRKLLGLADVPTQFAPYIQSAEQIREGILRDLASDVGGGQVSSIVAMLVSLAARAKAMSLLCQDCAMLTDGEHQIGFLDRADKYGTTARGHLIAAREIAAKDALARGKRRPAPAATPTFTAADVRRAFKLDEPE